MDAKFNQEALSARTLRLQKKNDAPSTAQSHSHASTVEAQRTFSHLEQVAHSQISTPKPHESAQRLAFEPVTQLIYTPVVSAEQRQILAAIVEERQTPIQISAQKTPTLASGKRQVAAPIQSTNLLTFWSPQAAQKAAQAASETFHQQLPSTTHTTKSATAPHIQVQIDERQLSEENQMENQLIQSDLLKQMAALQRTVLIMNERILQLQSTPHIQPIPISVATPADSEFSALKNISEAEKFAIRTARNIGSQDSAHSQDGPMLRHLAKTKEGYYREDFVSSDHDSSPEFSNSERESSQSSFKASQVSDTANVPNPEREYNFRPRTARAHVPSQLPRELIQQNSHENDAVAEVRPEQFSIDIDDFISDDQCERCGVYHGYVAHLCTEIEDIDGHAIESLSASELNFRNATKHNLLQRKFMLKEQAKFEEEKRIHLLDLQHWQHQRDVFMRKNGTQWTQSQISNSSEARSLSQVAPSTSVSLHHRAPTNTQEIAADDLSDGQSQRSSRSQDMQQIVSATATQIGAALAQALGGHRGQPNQLMTNDPPKITNISDSIYLMDVIWPGYQEYVHKGGKTSLWNLYSHDQKKTILELFRDPVVLIDGESAITIHRDRNYFDRFTNEQFLECLCGELGFPDVVTTERAFKAIKFAPPASARINWVNYKTKWDLTLKQTSASSRLSSKSMVNIFKQGIPDHYFRTCFEQQNHKDWLAAYAWCMLQLSNFKFLEGMNRHASSHLSEIETKHASEVELLKAQIATLKGSTSAKPKFDDSKSAKPVETKVTIKGKFESQGNVNPKWDPENPRDDNPSKKLCGTCDGLHKYADEFCTASKKKGTSTDTPRLSPLVLQQRKYDRQELGHYCNALTAKPASIADHHETAAAASATIQASTKSNGWKSKGTGKNANA
jgi:hypothetical protein